MSILEQFLNQHPDFEKISGTKWDNGIEKIDVATLNECINFLIEKGKIIFTSKNGLNQQAEATLDVCYKKSDGNLKLVNIDFLCSFYVGKKHLMGKYIAKTNLFEDSDDNYYYISDVDRYRAHEIIEFQQS